MFGKQMLRMGGDQKCALRTKKWTFYIFFLEKEGKERKKKAPEKGEDALPVAPL